MMDGTWNRLVLMAGRLPGSSETSQGWSAEKGGVAHRTCYTFLPSPGLNILFGGSGDGFCSGLVVVY